MRIKEKEGAMSIDRMQQYVNSLMNCISTQQLTENERSRNDFIGLSKDRILTIYGNLCKVTLLGDLPEKSETIEICFRTYTISCLLNNDNVCVSAYVFHNKEVQSADYESNFDFHKFKIDF